MLELAVAPCGGNQTPAVLLQYPNDLSDLHALILLRLFRAAALSLVRRTICHSAAGGVVCQNFLRPLFGSFSMRHPRIFAFPATHLQQSNKPAIVADVCSIVGGRLANRRRVRRPCVRSGGASLQPRGTQSPARGLGPGQLSVPERPSRAISASGI